MLHYIYNIEKRLMSVQKPLKNRIGRIVEAGKTDFIEREISSIESDQVVIKVAYSAICGSDLHIFHGKHPSVKLPTTIGHELSGEIVETGSHAQLLDLKGLYYAMWRQQIGERKKQL